MNKMETIMGKWTILETVMEEYHDGPIYEVGVGKEGILRYFDREE